MLTKSENVISHNHKKYLPVKENRKLICQDFLNETEIFNEGTTFQSHTYLILTLLLSFFILSTQNAYEAPYVQCTHLCVKKF